jgi:hypothetical protein
MRIVNMKRRARTTLGFATVFALLLSLGAISGIAEPDYIFECGDCHTVNPSYTMSSNSTGEATVGVPFTLRIVATKPTPGGNNFYLSVQNGWADNDNFTFTPASIRDNSVGDLTLANFIITSDFTFTPKSTGNNTIRAWCAIDWGSQYIDIPINVTEIAAPTIDSPPDMQVDEGNMTASVTWNPTSTYPDSYEVYDNEVLFSSGSWDGSAVTIGLNTLSVGTHNLTCVVYDLASQTAVDQVDVLIVDNVLPTINHLANSTIAEGPSAALTWTPSDNNPSSFEVYRERVLIDSGEWDGNDVVVSLKGLTVGEYNFTVIVFDTSGNSAQDTTFVTIIDDTTPSIDNPIDIEYSLGSTGNTIVWNVSDTNPDTFTIFRNEVLIRAGSWTGAPIIESIDGLAIGVYNFTLLVNDTSGNWISDEVNVSVIFPPEPTIDHPPDQMIAEGSLSNVIDWNPDDVDPSKYEIFRDSVLIKSGLWNSSSETISVSIDGLSVGVYVYEIIVYDVANHTVADSVTITVYDGMAPTIDAPDNIVIDEGFAGQTITWSPNDLNPSSYEIYVDDVLVWTGLWNSSSEAIVASCDGLAYGVHSFTLFVTDIGDNSESDEVVVTVLDGTPPIVDSPSDIIYQVSTVGHNITWTPTDAHPISFSVQINGVVVLSGGWDGQPIIINVDWLSIGSYEYTLTITDIGGNTETDMVIVTVTLDNPSVTPTETTTTTGGGPTPPVDDDEQNVTATFSMVMLSMGIIIGILALGLILDRRRV